MLVHQRVLIRVDINETLWKIIFLMVFLWWLASWAPCWMGSNISEVFSCWWARLCLIQVEDVKRQKELLLICSYMMFKRKPLESRSSLSDPFSMISPLQLELVASQNRCSYGHLLVITGYKIPSTTQGLEYPGLQASEAQGLEYFQEHCRPSACKVL